VFCCLACLSGAGRRRFWASDAAVEVGSAAVPAAAPAALGGERWIDIHCHLFNILDLPALEFIERTRLTMPWPLRLGAVAALLPLIGGLNGMAITAEAELEALRSNRAGRLMNAAPAGIEIDTLTTLRVIDGREQLGNEGGAALLAAPLFDDILPPAAKATHERPRPPKAGANLVRDAVNEIAPTRNLSMPASDDELRRLAEHIDAITGGGARSPGLPAAPGSIPESVGAFLGWGQEMASPRDVLAGRLLEQFPAGAEVLLTPALVDYSRWLGISDSDRDPVSNLDAQLDVMAAISRRRAANGGVQGRRAGLFCFAPFDPWRMAEDSAKGRPTLLDRLQPRVTDGSVIGLKLYPPMGFRPTGNARRDISEFPEDLIKLAGGHPGAMLDGVLDKVFAWCEAEEVAVMAHSGNSNESRRGYGLLAGPQGWGEVLQAHPNLRLNLAHFGGIFGFGSAKADEREATRAWAEAIAGMMETYPYLYADVGFGSQLLAEQCQAQDECGVTISYLEDLVRRRPIVSKRLMYGSDWVMVGMVDDADQYAARIRASVASVFPGEAIEDFRWRNAARFLGMAEEDKARQRMRSFLDPLTEGLVTRFNPDKAEA
jgi:predicted TIM-barrel fold metal-dependent hydrolase